MSAASAAEGPVVVIAGGGALPDILLTALARKSRPYRILALRGFADRSLKRRADAAVNILDIAGVLECLGRWQPCAVCLAGAVTRPQPAAFFGALAAFRNSAELRQLMARGDDHLLRAVVAMLEEHGHHVVGAHEVAPDLLAAPGQLGSVPVPETTTASIRTGFRCLADISPYDIGQGLVVHGERVTAIEGAEGTDRMLSRVAALSRGFLLRPAKTGGVLVKSAKRGQERRVDLPAVGPRTVVRAASAGLAGIAIGAGQVLVVEREKMIAEANRCGLFLAAFDPEDQVAAP